MHFIKPLVFSEKDFCQISLDVAVRAKYAHEVFHMRSVSSQKSKVAQSQSGMLLTNSFLKFPNLDKVRIFYQKPEPNSQGDCSQQLLLDSAGSVFVG